MRPISFLAQWRRAARFSRTRRGLFSTAGSQRGSSQSQFHRLQIKREKTPAEARYQTQRPLEDSDKFIKAAWIGGYRGETRDCFGPRIATFRGMGPYSKQMAAGVATATPSCTTNTHPSIPV